MHHNFWSKLYFYLKFQENVYFAIQNMYSEFQLLAHPFCLFVCLFVFFLSHSVAVAAWSEILRVDPQMIYIELFITWCAGASSAPKQYLFSLGSWKNIGHSSKKDNHPFHSKAFVLLYKFETSWALLGRLCSRGVFLPSQGPLNLNILNTFSWPFLDMAC